MTRLAQLGSSKYRRSERKGRAFSSDATSERWPAGLAPHGSHSPPRPPRILPVRLNTRDFHRSPGFLPWRRSKWSSWGKKVNK